MSFGHYLQIFHYLLFLFVLLTGSEQQKVSTLDAFLDLIRNMFPENVIEATLRQTQTYYQNVTKMPSTCKRLLLFILLLFN